VTYKILAYKDGWADSDVATAMPIRAMRILPTPTFRSDAVSTGGSGSGSGMRRLLDSEFEGARWPWSAVDGEMRLNLTEHDVGEHGSKNRADFQRCVHL
jgi:hypothetical protein